MKIKFERNYRKQETGNLVFVYKVQGTQSEIESYKLSQGTNLRSDDDGNPLWFTSNFAGDSAPLIITAKGKAVVDMSEYDKLNSLVGQFEGTAFGAELAKQAVEKLLGGKSTTSKASQPEAIPANDSAEDLSDM